MASNTLSPDLIHRIEQDLGRIHDDMGSWSRRIVAHRAHPYSDVFRMEFRSDARSVQTYIKIPKPPDPAHDDTLSRLSTEFEVLSRLSRHFDSHPDLGVVSPVGFYPEHHALCTIAAPGDRLSDHITSLQNWKHPIDHLNNLHDWCARSGKWLAEFHSVTAAGSQRIDREEIIGYCRNRIAFIRARASASPIGRRDGDRIMKALENVLDDAQSRGTPHAGRHNDFAGHNIIVAPERLNVLDFYLYDIGPVQYDLFNFWCNLEALKVDPRYPDRMLGSLQNTFLSAYHLDFDNEPLIQALKLRHDILRLATIAARGHQKSWLARIAYKRQAAHHRERVFEFMMKHS